MLTLIPYNTFQVIKNLYCVCELIKKFLTINQILTIACHVYAFMTSSQQLVLKNDLRVIFLTLEAVQLNFPRGKIIILINLTSYERCINGKMAACAVAVAHNSIHFSV